MKIVEKKYIVDILIVKLKIRQIGQKQMEKGVSMNYSSYLQLFPFDFVQSVLS